MRSHDNTGHYTNEFINAFRVEGPSGNAQRLKGARHHLWRTQAKLHAIRRMGTCYPTAYLTVATLDFYAALDRVWELQCMCEGRL